MQKVAEGVYRGPFEEVYPALREYGAVPEALEMFWNELGDIPVDDNGILQESFLWWPKGTDREDVWHWFDEKYPGGVKKLMCLEEVNTREETYGQLHEMLEWLDPFRMRKIIENTDFKGASFNEVIAVGRIMNALDALYDGLSQLDRVAKV